MLIYQRENEFKILYFEFYFVWRVFVFFGWFAGYDMNLKAQIDLKGTESNSNPMDRKVFFSRPLLMFVV